MRYQILSFALFFLFSSVLAGQQSNRDQPWSWERSTPVTFEKNRQLNLQEADLYTRLFDAEAAYFALENAVAQDPFSASAYVRRARFKKMLGMTTEAAADLRQASRMNPYMADLLGAENPYSILKLLSAEPERAVLFLDPAKKLEVYYELLEEEYLNRNVDLEELEQLEEVVFEMLAGRMWKARAALDSFLRSYPNSAIGYDLQGLELASRQQYEAAAGAFSRAVALRPDYAVAWYNFSQMEGQRGRMEKAREYLDRAIQLEDNLEKAYFDRALILKSMGDAEGALRDYNKIIDLEGGVYVEAVLNRGLTRKMLGDFKGALADLDLAVEAFPDNALIYMNRGNLYLLFGYLREAVDDYSRAIQLDPNFAEAYYNRGLANFIQLNNRSACFDLSKSAELGFEEAAEKLPYFCIE